jgi:hypothetical protein
VDGLVIELVPLARAICERYYLVYPDEQKRYGAAGADWCRHDMQWLLSWAVADMIGVTELDEQACWLARVLDSRDFPMGRLVRGLRLAAQVIRDSNIDPAGPAIAERLDHAAGAVENLALG